MPQECFCFMQDKVLETQSSFSVSSVSLSSSASGIWSCAGWSAASSSEPKVQTPSAQQPDAAAASSVVSSPSSAVSSASAVSSGVSQRQISSSSSSSVQQHPPSGRSSQLQALSSLLSCAFFSRGCSCGCDHCSNDGSFHVDTSFLRHLVSVVIWKFCGSAAENTDVVYILIIPCFQRKYKPRHPEFWRLCGKNFQSGEDQTCSSACFRSAVISPMFSRPTEMRIRPPSIPAAFSCSSVSWR